MKTASALSTFRRFIAISAAFILLISFQAKSQSNSEISKEVRTEMEQLNKQLENSILKKDFATIIDLYSDDATLIVPGGKKLQGRKEIADYWYKLNGTKTLKSEILELGGNGKMVYQVGRWTITNVKDGVENTITTDVILVWKRQQDFEYKIQLNSSNNPVAVTSKHTEPFEAARP